MTQIQQGLAMEPCLNKETIMTEESTAIDHTLLNKVNAAVGYNEREIDHLVNSLKVMLHERKCHGDAFMNTSAPENQMYVNMIDSINHDIKIALGIDGCRRGM